MEKTVVPAGSSAGELIFFQEDSVNPPKGQVSEHAGSGSSATDNCNLCFHSESAFSDRLSASECFWLNADR
jgi:hypothetical protein